VNTTYTTVTTEADLTSEILEAAEGIFDGWYADETRIDWEDFLDRLDGIPLNDGTTLDLGDSVVSPAVKAIKAHIRRYAASGR
jgi:hypothetical protein